MSPPLTIETTIHFHRRGPGRCKQLQSGSAPPPPTVTGRVPRVARMMALAIRLDRLVCEGAVASYAELARLGHVSRARVTQILNLLYLSPRIQESILFLPSTQRGRDPVILRDLLPIASVRDWQRQEKLWRELITKRSRS